MTEKPIDGLTLVLTINLEPRSCLPIHSSTKYLTTASIYYPIQSSLTRGIAADSVTDDESRENRLVSILDL